MANNVRLGVLNMLAACFFFTAMALFVGVAHRWEPSLSTFVISAVRAVVNLAVLVAMARGNIRLLFGDMRMALWARGVTGAGALITYFGALEHLGVGEAAFLNQTSAIWVAALAPFVLGERTRALTWLAILGSVAGVALLAHPRADAEMLGRGLGLASGLCAAGAYLAVRRATDSNPAITIVFYFTLLSSLVAIVLAVVTGASLPQTWPVWLCLAGAGVAATLGQLFMTRSYQSGPAALMSATSAASPLMTTLAGWWLLGQVPDDAGRVGMGILVFTSVVLPLVNR